MTISPKQKQLISILMVILILLTTINLDVFKKNNVAYAESILGIEQPVDISLFWYEAGGTTYQIGLPVGITRNTTVSGKSINFEILKDRHILVFGQPFGDKDINGEYRYLGYTIDGNSYSNKEFINDADSGRKPYEKNIQPLYIVEQGNFPENRALKEETIKEVLAEEGFPNSWQNRDDLLDYFLVQGLKGEGTQASIRMYHKTSDGKIWYQTLTKDYPVEDVKPLVMEVTADFDLNSSVYENQSIGFKDKSYANGTDIINWNLKVIDTATSNVIKEFNNKNEAENELKNGLSEGYYKLELYLNNGEDGASFREDTAIKYITVNKQEPDSDPIALVEAPDAEINEVFTVSAKGSIASYGAKIINYKWTIDGTYRSEYDGQAEITQSFSSEGSHTYSVEIEDTKGKIATNSDTNTITDNTPTSGVAKVRVPSIVYEGVPFDVSTNGSRVTYGTEKYSIKKAVEEGIAGYDFDLTCPYSGRLRANGGEISTEELGVQEIEFEIEIKGTDPKDTDTFEVKPTPVIASAKISGTQKDDRKQTLTVKTWFNPKYPINNAKTYVEIKDLSTGEKVRVTKSSHPDSTNIKTNSMQYSNTETHEETITLDFLIKTNTDKDFEFTIYQEDTRGNNDTYTFKKTIKADKYPIAELFTLSEVIRDPVLDNKAPVVLEDRSYSTDNDFVTRTWLVAFDNDHDNSFLDETYYDVRMLDGFMDLTGDMRKVSFNKSTIGKVDVRLISKEQFGQETIESFVNDNDRLETITNKVVDVINVKPYVDFKVRKSGKMEIAFITHEKDRATLENEIVDFKSNILNNNINITTHVVEHSDIIESEFEELTDLTVSTKDVTRYNQKYIFQYGNNYLGNNYYERWVDIYEATTGNKIASLPKITTTDYSGYALYTSDTVNGFIVRNKVTGENILYNEYAVPILNYTSKGINIGIFGKTSILDKELNLHIIDNSTYKKYDRNGNLVINKTLNNFISGYHYVWSFIDNYNIAVIDNKVISMGLRSESQDGKIIEIGAIVLDATNGDVLKEKSIRTIDFNTTSMAYAMSKTKVSVNQYTGELSYLFSPGNTDCLYDTEIKAYDIELNEIGSATMNTSKYRGRNGYGLYSETFNGKTYFMFRVYYQSKRDTYFYVLDSNNTEILSKDLSDCSDKYIYLPNGNLYFLIDDYYNKYMKIETKNGHKITYGIVIGGNYRVDDGIYHFRNLNIYTSKYNKTIHRFKTYNNYKTVLETSINSIQWKSNDSEKYIVPIGFDNYSMESYEIDEIINITSDLIFTPIGDNNFRSIGEEFANKTGGTFFETTSISDGLNQLENYLVNEKEPKDIIYEYYFTKDDFLIYDTFYNDYESDPSKSSEWYYIHQEGTHPDRNKWLSSPLTQIEYVGTYTVKHRQKDNTGVSTYDKYSNEAQIIIHIVESEDDIPINPPQETVVPPTINLSVEGDLRINHRVDFHVTATEGTNPIDWNSLDITINNSDVRPTNKPTQKDFSRVFTTTGNKSITIKLSDTEGNQSTQTFNFTIDADNNPTASFSISGDGQRDEEGKATFKLTDSSSSNDDSIGTIEYFIEDTKYVDNGDGTFSPSGLTWYQLELNEAGEFEIEKVGNSRIKQVVTEYYENGIGLDGYDLDQYRVFKTAEIIKTVTVNNDAPTLEYTVTPTVIVKGQGEIQHDYTTTDDTPFGDTIEYRFTHNSSYYQNSEGTHVNSGIVNTEPLTKPTQKGEYTFEARVLDEDGTYSDWVNGGIVYVVSKPVADFELLSDPIKNNGKNTELVNDVFEKGSIITVDNDSFNEDYMQTVQNHGIKYTKVEYRDITTNNWTTIFEMDNMSSYFFTFDLPQINEIGNYEVRMTIRSNEGIEATSTKQFKVLDLRLSSSLEPSTIYASQSYKINATVSKDSQGVVAKINKSLKVRYIRDWTNGSTSNSGDHWVEIEAIDKAGDNVALNKSVTCGGTPPSGSRPLSRLVDGDKNTYNYTYTSSGSPTYMQIDLGAVYELDKINVWHYYADGRTYYNTKTEVSVDGTTWYTVFDSAIEGEYQESAQGNSIDLTTQWVTLNKDYEDYEEKEILVYETNFDNIDDFSKWIAYDNTVQPTVVDYGGNNVVKLEASPKGTSLIYKTFTLEKGERYRYRYRILFDEPATSYNGLYWENFYTNTNNPDHRVYHVPNLADTNLTGVWQDIEGEIIIPNDSEYDYTKVLFRGHSNSTFKFYIDDFEFYKVTNEVSNQYYSVNVDTAEIFVDNNYNIEVYAIYPYNQEIRQDLTLTVNTPLDISINLTPLYPTGIPTSENIEIEAITTCPIDVDNVEVWLEGESSINLTKGPRVGNNITWTGTYTIPSTKPDKDYYNFYAKATIQNGNSKTISEKVNVLTPINLVPTAPGEISPNDVITLSATTSKYVNSVTVKLYDSLNNYIDTINLTGTINGNSKNWTKSYTVPSLSEGDYQFRFTATTPNGNSEIKTLQIKVVTLQIISATLMPQPALAGDELIFTIETKGYADKIEIIVPNDIIVKDDRVGKYTYPLVFNVNGAIDHKTDILTYITNVKTDKTLDPDNNRLRPPYTFTVRAYKGTLTKEVNLTLDVRRSVLDLIKPGIKSIKK